MPARLETLAEIEARCWSELAAAARRGSVHAWRLMALATTDGNAAFARSVILREAHADRRELVVYTDARSAKVAQIQARPAGTLLGWWPEMSWQLRLTVSLAVDIGGLAALSRWARLKLTPAAGDYLSPVAPGSVLDNEPRRPATREHFAVITATVLAIDWLELHPDGHRRAAFDAEGARWLQP